MQATIGAVLALVATANAQGFLGNSCVAFAGSLNSNCGNQNRDQAAPIPGYNGQDLPQGSADVTSGNPYNAINLIDPTPTTPIFVAPVVVAPVVIPPVPTVTPVPTFPPVVFNSIIGTNGVQCTPTSRVFAGFTCVNGRFVSTRTSPTIFNPAVNLGVNQCDGSRVFANFACVNGRFVSTGTVAPAATSSGILGGQCDGSLVFPNISCVNGQYAWTGTGTFNGLQEGMTQSNDTGNFIVVRMADNSLKWQINYGVILTAPARRLLQDDIQDSPTGDMPTSEPTIWSTTEAEQPTIYTTTATERQLSLTRWLNAQVAANGGSIQNGMYYPPSMNVPAVVVPAVIADRTWYPVNENVPAMYGTGCSCDFQCVSMGDCCADYNRLCAGRVVVTPTSPAAVIVTAPDATNAPIMLVLTAAVPLPTLPPIPDATNPPAAPTQAPLFLTAPTFTLAQPVATPAPVLAVSAPPTFLVLAPATPDVDTIPIGNSNTGLTIVSNTGLTIANPTTNTGSNTLSASDIAARQSLFGRPANSGFRGITNQNRIN